MQKLILILLAFIMSGTIAYGQKYYSKTGSVHFLSEAPLEKIQASNNNAYVVFDASTGQMEWAVLIKGFKFEKALMQQHFNENYMDSDQFPKAVFKGTIVDKAGINLEKDGSYNVTASGTITIHGVTKPLTAPGQITVKNGKVNASSSFTLTVADFNIEVPKIVRDNIAKTVRVTVRSDLQPL